MYVLLYFQLFVFFFKIEPNHKVGAQYRSATNHFYYVRVKSKNV